MKHFIIIIIMFVTSIRIDRLSYGGHVAFLLLRLFAIKYDLYYFIYFLLPNHDW